MRFGFRSFNVSKHLRCYIKVPRDKLNDHAENLVTLKNMIPACFSSSITLTWFIHQTTKDVNIVSYTL